ncbi:hypothetical protein EDD15DRAFT_2367813 [Pisolithus albus]|nr:hypothetical protein EDD15DRAFT_2367813 [Pisolithus albus]
MPNPDTPPGTARTKAPVTRNNTRSTTLSNLRDPLTVQTTTVTDHVTGLRYLQKHEFLPIGIIPTPARLTTALFQVAQLPHVPASAIDGIRAVAFLLERVEANSLVSELQKALPPTISETVANHVVASISPHIASLQDAATKLSLPTRTQTDDSPNPSQATANQAVSELTPQITSIHKSLNQFQEKLSILDAIHQHLAITNTSAETEALGATVDRLENLVETVNFNLNDTSNAINILAPSLEATQSQINSLHKRLTTPPQAQPAQTQSQTTRSYSEAVKNATTTSRVATKAMAKAETRSRQVLFTPRPNQTLYSKDTDPAAIVADITDQLIRIQGEEDPYVNVKSAVCLNNGNLLLELNSTEAANWMRDDPARRDLAESLGIDAVVKEQTFPIVIPFFPVTHDVTDPTFLNAIELENDLPNDSIHSIRWVKNPEHRKPGQRVAHALLLTRNAAPANHLLRNGMYVLRTKLFPKKEKKEPVRTCAADAGGPIASRPATTPNANTALAASQMITPAAAGTARNSSGVALLSMPNIQTTPSPTTPRQKPGPNPCYHSTTPQPRHPPPPLLRQPRPLTGQANRPPPQATSRKLTPLATRENNAN